jgi:L-alanine-DL-glutamate epimerase-like enolase superfamily enzyme
MAGPQIIETQAHMLGIELEKPFPLGFGTLSHLPRVLFQIRALDGERVVDGIGEASIDFPFSHYDAFDIYHALSELQLEGLELNDREKILSSQDKRTPLLEDTPAAFTALNMALDDVCGKSEGINLMDFYGRRRHSAQALASISFQDNALLVIKESQERYRQGYIPKPKVGKGFEEDLRTISFLDQSAQESNFVYVLDFNAQYSFEDAEKLLKELRSRNCSLNNALFIEQPTREEDGIQALIAFRTVFNEVMGRKVTVIADESFVTLDDAIACVQGGIDLNFKIHKIGGLFYAREIEQRLLSLSLNSSNSMVGGTFPTAIGRTYDQQCGSVLVSTNMPGDGMEPSTDWFTDNKHIILENFEQKDSKGCFVPKTGTGLGISPDWAKINQFIIDDPREEYRQIRNGKPGKKIEVQLKPGQEYSTIYEAKSGKKPDWNLDGEDSWKYW